MGRESQKSAEGKHRVEFLWSPAGTDTNVPGDAVLLLLELKSHESF